MRFLPAVLVSGLVHGAASLLSKQPPAYDIGDPTLPRPSFSQPPPAQGSMEGPTFAEQPPEGDRDIDDPIIGVRHVQKAPVLPNFGGKHVLDPIKYPSAKCLDGTSGAYYFSPGHNAETNGMKKFYVFKLGGGGCSGYRDCYNRAYSMLGSSHEKHGWHSYMDLHSWTGAPHIGMDRNKENNPLMWDWNHVVIIYCDGGYFGGSNSTPTYYGTANERLYFNGADIQAAVMADLDEKYQLSSAEDLVVGGCSAGSLGTFMTVDWIARQPSAPKTGRIAAMTCSGFFLDIDEAWYTTSKAFPYWAFNVTETMDPGCIADNPEPYKCFIPEISVHYIKTPIFFWESQYDQWQLANLYASNCWGTKCAHKHAAHVTEAMHRAWASMPHTGGFLSSCVHHCEESDIGDVANIKPIDNDLPLVAFAKWYIGHFSGAVGHRRIWHDNSTFPCRDCCPQGLGGPRKTLTSGLE